MTIDKQNQKQAAEVAPFAVMEVIYKSGAAIDFVLDNEKEFMEVRDLVMKYIQGKPDTSDVLTVVQDATEEQPEIHTVIELNKEIIGYKLMR
jgi:hypothetical protein